MNESSVIILVAILGLAVLMICINIASAQSRERDVAGRIARVEKQLDRLIRHVGVPETTGSLDEVRQLAHAGKTEPAIKAYREHTGVGLKEAREAVEAMARAKSASK